MKLLPHELKQLELYIRLKGRSLMRLFNELPFLIRLFFVAVFILFSMLLFQMRLDVTVENILLTSLVFVLAGIRLCRLKPAECVLLKVLQVPQMPLKLLKCILLSVPFFLLNRYAGLINLTMGTVFVACFADRQIIRKPFRSFYRPTAYQWNSMFRSGGIWILLIGLVLLLIALYHGNRNMAYFALGWVTTFPCFVAYYSLKDPQVWLRTYKNVPFLLFCKLKELLANTLLTVSLPLLIAFLWDGANGLSYLACAGFFCFCNLSVFYGYYVCYSGFVLAIIVTAMLLFAAILFFSLWHFLAVAAILPICMCLHFLAVQNLKSTIYVIPESTY